MTAVCLALLFDYDVAYYDVMQSVEDYNVTLPSRSLPNVNLVGEKIRLI